MTTILVAHQRADVSELVGQFIAEIGAGKPPVVRNQAAALSAVQAQAPDAVVIGIDLPAHEQSGPVSLGGLQLAASLRAKHPGLLLVLVAASTTRELSERVAKLDAALALEGLDFEDSLKLALGKAHAPPGPQQLPLAAAPAAGHEPVRYVIEIHLHAEGDCLYCVRSSGDLVPERYQIPFAVKREDLQDLKDATALLGTSAQWEKDYELIGERLCAVLLGGNLRVVHDMGRLQGVTEQRPGSQIAICFVVDKDVYPIALEALRNCFGGVPQYWLQSAPLWRQIDARARRFPLFQGGSLRDKPINCLVIDANTGGMVKKWGSSFTRLPGIRREALSLVSKLRTGSTVHVAKVGHIWQEKGQVWTSISQGKEVVDQPSAASFSNTLRELLTKGGPWDLVHFAGHTYYDASHDWGYVVMPSLPTPGGRQGPPDYVGTPEFSRWLEQTRLVYMSSCRSSSQDFVFNFCQQSTPAVTGFRWDIEDKVAVLHSNQFYDELFSRFSIEEAMHQTWTHMYGCERGSKAWASSQLVMQFAA